VGYPKRYAKMKITPFTSIGDAILGSGVGDVVGVLGENYSTKDENFGDGEVIRTVEYPSLGFSLMFCKDDEFRLGAITTKSIDATLKGERVIGLSEEAFLFKVESIMGERPRLDDDFEESGKDYVLDSFELSFWVLDGVVSSITLFPRYDSSGNIPDWPTTG